MNAIKQPIPAITAPGTIHKFNWALVKLLYPKTAPVYCVSNDEIPINNPRKNNKEAISLLRQPHNQW